jgi:hypothetical protein
MPTFTMVRDDVIETSSTTSTTINVTHSGVYSVSSAAARLVDEARMAEDLLNETGHVVKITHDTNRVIERIENIAKKT